MSRSRSFQLRSRAIRILFHVVVLVVVGFGLPQAKADSVADAEKSIQEKQIKKHVVVLASDTFEGREAGSRGGRASGVYLVERLKKIGVRPAGIKGSYYQEFGNGYRNVLAMIPGRHPQWKREFIVVCAHYDHVGYGTRRNSLGAIGYIHNGADDNASGTAGLLELIKAMSQLKPDRSILFAFWDAEEKGLLGSQHWIGNPTIPLKQISLAINIDMIGRLRENRVKVFGSRSAIGWRRFVCEQNREVKLQFDFPWVLKKESDHYPFIVNGVPTIMLHTGKHADYHRPSDDSHKLKYQGIERISRVLFRLAHTAANAPVLPKYRREAVNEDDRDRSRLMAPLPALPARLGVSWSSGANLKGPLEIGSVTAGSPAEVGGLKTGDLIEEFGGFRVGGSAGFRGIVMASTNPVTVRVRRKGVEQSVTLKLTLKGSARRVGISWGDDVAEPGVVILRRVITGSPANLAGLQVGDRVMKVSGERFQSNAEFRELIAGNRDTLKLSYERNGQIKTVLLKLLVPGRKVAGPVRAVKPRR